MPHESKFSTKDFLRKLDETVACHSLLEHPFYQLWNEGKLSKHALAEYSKQYYAHVDAFPTYLSAVHSRCNDPEVRQLLLENLIEEEHGEENHPELWLRFAEGLGVDRKEARDAGHLPETEKSVAMMRDLSCSDNFIAGVAALYAYESQVPEVAKTKRHGLNDFYGIDDPAAVSYFSVHEKADIEHSAAERDILVKYCDTRESQDQALAAADSAAKAMWTFLDGVYREYVAEESLN